MTAVNSMWEPLALQAAASLFRDARFPWWVAGGLAIEMAVGRQLRPHGDVDILVLRRDQLAAQRILAAWDLWASDPPGTLRPWKAQEWLPTVSDIWCRDHSEGPWRLQLMLDESDGDLWQSRRNRRVEKPIRDLGARTSDDIPYVVPEVLLFYKAKSPRPKDEIDCAAVLPILTEGQRAWLRSAILTAYGRTHPWLPRLAL